MFKTKGFSANNSLKRRAVIVDAPDLPPEECEFFITSAGVADSEKVELPVSKGLDFEVETLYEESGDSGSIQTDSEKEIPLVEIKGVGKGSAENLKSNGINTISELLEADPEDLSAKISGASSKTILEWQSSAKALIKT